MRKDLQRTKPEREVDRIDQFHSLGKKGLHLRMISLKKFLDMDSTAVLRAEPESEGLFPVTLQSYRAVLGAIGKTAAHISPALGADLEANLQRLEHRVAVNTSSESVKQNQKQVEVQLREWGDRLSDHLKSKADEVREILVALSKTAESVGSWDHGYSNQFKEVTGRLEQIANLDDLTEIRSSLVKRVSELKGSVDQMTRDSKELVAHLRAEVSIYETKLKSAEQLSLRDELTRVANRRSVEERIRWCIECNQTFCFVMLDLNGFKQVNDRHGHLAGDDLLKQFAVELQSNARSGDLVGRWGGDEFVVIIACDKTGAMSHVDRIREWVFGKYTVNGGTGTEGPVIHVEASIGVAEWKAGKTLQELIAEADGAMYKDKNRSRLRE
jgi:diguanylate cyclase (GGDEF)-like protein